MPRNVLPDAARVLPKAGQAVWLKAFNEALDNGEAEDEASKLAWAAVKRAGYGKDSKGKWSKSMDNELVMNDDDTFQIGVPLIKINVDKRTVAGFATLDNVDQANDIVDADASIEAFSEWAGNIREMHQKVAVGKAIDWKPDTFTDETTGTVYNGVWVTAKISKGAEDTWQKVLDGTLAGFSIGGATLNKERVIAKAADGTSQNAWKITKYKLTELSLVDNPCNRLATISLVKSVDGVVEVDDTIADGDIEKAYNGETGEFVSMEAEFRGVVSALESLRDKAIAEKADHIVSDASDKLACFRSKVRWEAQDADYHNGVTKEDTAMGETVEKSDEELQENAASDINGNVELTSEAKGLIQKFVDFIKGEETPAAAETEVEATGEENNENNEEVTPEMNADEVAKAIEAAGEELSKSADEKFGQVGESLVKITELLEKVATTDNVDELKKEFAAQVEELTGRIEAIENTGAIKKSGDDAGDAAGETIEKSDDGFWGGNILPEFVKSR